MYYGSLVNSYLKIFKNHDGGSCQLLVATCHSIYTHIPGFVPVYDCDMFALVVVVYFLSVIFD